MRFGAEDKLCAILDGQPLARHAVAATQGMRFARRVAIVSGTDFPFAEFGFDMLINDDPARGLSSSIRIGTEAARAGGASAVLIMLADMPCVEQTHLERLFAASDGERSLVYSTGGARPSPPALIGAAHFDLLAALIGDQGARELAARAVHVTAPAGDLVDIDTLADLNREARRRALRPFRAK